MLDCDKHISGVQHTTLALVRHIGLHISIHTALLVKNILPESIECVFVWQKEQLRLSNAVLCAERFVGN